MAKKSPWGHESRHCVYCGKVGPRMLVLGGYAHKYCLPKSELSARRREDREARAKAIGAKVQAAARAGGADSGSQG